MEIKCKNCGSLKITKNGIVRKKQRYKCKDCKCNFVLGDKREKITPEGKALCVLLYSSGKSSYGFIAKLFKVSRSAVLKIVKKVASRLPEPTIDSEIKEIQMDEMWHYIGQKNEKYGYGEPWIVLQVKPLDGLLAMVMLKHLKNSTKNLSKQKQ
jgi:transposase-like protein